SISIEALAYSRSISAISGAVASRSSGATDMAGVLRATAGTSARFLSRRSTLVAFTSAGALQSPELVAVAIPPRLRLLLGSLGRQLLRSSACVGLSLPA